MSAMAYADNTAAQLETIHVKAEQEQGFKVDQSANSKYVAPFAGYAKISFIISNN